MTRVEGRQKFILLCHRLKREWRTAIMIFFMGTGIALQKVINFLKFLTFFKELLHVPFYIAYFLQPRLKHLRVIRFVLGVAPLEELANNVRYIVNVIADFLLQLKEHLEILRKYRVKGFLRSFGLSIGLEL